MEKIKLNTSQNVSVEYQIAGVGDRILAYIFDSLFMIIYALFFIALMSVLNPGREGMFIVIIFLILPLTFYHFIFETIFNGQSPGKKLRNIKVVRLDNTPAGVGDYFSRWVVGLVELFLMPYVAFITIVASKNGQRLGDMLANTTVVKLQTNYDIHQTVVRKLNDDYEPYFPQAEWISEKDIDLLNEIINKTAKRHSIPEKLEEALFTAKDKICRKYRIKSNDEPIILFKKLILDYNHYKGILN